jgi:lipoprotein NlpI
VRSGDRAAATANFRKAVELEPDNAHYHYVLGLALEPTDVKAALDELDKAYRLRRQTEYLHAMCEVALRNGHSRARACLSELKPLVPDDVYRRLVQSYPR